MKSSEHKMSVPTCKFLGLKTDPRSLASYPSVSNCCYGCLPEATPILVHQREFCLTENHKNCPVFMAESPIALPAELVHKNSTKSNRNLNFWSVVVVIGIIVGLAASIILVLPGMLASQETPEWVAPTALGTIESSTVDESNPAGATLALVEPTETATAILTNAPTATSEPTATPRVVLLPLEGVLGTEYKVIIHRVSDGESLSSLAQANGTLNNAILDATHRLVLPLTVGKLVVIPLQTRNWNNLPPLEPYQVSQAAISLDDLAQLLGVDASLLKYYNGCEDCLIQQGSWIVVPRAP
jgi:hypothetical protein